MHTPEVLYDDLLDVAVLLLQLLNQQQVCQPLLSGLTKTYQQPYSSSSSPQALTHKPPTKRMHT